MTTVNRVDIEYQALTEDREGLGLTDFRLQLQGRGWRPPRDGEDLFSVRGWLKTAGFTLRESQRFAQGHGIRPARYVETWTLHPPPPQPKPRGLKTEIRYDRHTKTYALIDGIDAVAHSPTRVEAEWTQLRYEAPDTDDLVQRFLTRYDHPDLTYRALRAGLMLAAGHIQPNGTPHSFDVISQTHDTGRIYRVDFGQDDNRAGWTCTILVDKDPRQVGQPCPDDKAPDLGHGPRCKHMIAAFLASRFPDTLNDKEGIPDQPPIGESETPSTEATQCLNSDSTTPEPEPQLRIVRRYADGRPAALSDGTLIRYTAGGREVRIPGGAT